MRLDDLRDELRTIAAEAPPAAHAARSVIRPAARRLWTRRIVASVATLAIVSGAVATVAHDQHHADRLSIAGSGPAGSGPAGSTPPLSPATIANGRWSAIARFPLATRTDESVIWTGSQMIVWGGHQDAYVLGDGAAYDPDTYSWRELPPAPISARTATAAVWTGREMIVWGGGRSLPGNDAIDGAAFDPVAWKWRRIAPSPLAPRSGADMVWTGTEAIVVGGHETSTGALTSALDAAAYDPATDRWRPIASLPAVSGAAVEDLRMVWTGEKLLVWELWSRTTNALRSFGLQLVEYTPSADAWQRGPEPQDPHRNVYAPMWTGSEVVSAPEPPLCDLPDGAQNCGSPPTSLHADELDPASGTWRPLPHGPADDGEIASVWTGHDLVVVSGEVNDRATGRTTVEAGTAAAWNPDTNAWTALPRAPFAPDLATGFWTGSEILIWGSDRGVRYDEAPTAGTSAPTGSRSARPTARRP